MMGDRQMTPEQRKLARHALGLPNKTNRSYRNYFTTRKVTPDHAAWKSMAGAGWAYKAPRSWVARSDTEVFILTRAGALLALDEGESLDPEDFPEGGE